MRIKKSAIIIFCIGVFFFIGFSDGILWAQISISPNIIEANIYPGSSKIFKVTISNPGGKVMDCNFNTFSMSVAPIGIPYVVDDSPRSCKDWVTLNP